MVAGGVGLAPFVTLAEALNARGTRTTLFYGARARRELYYVELFERLGVAVVLATEDGSRGVEGLITGAARATRSERCRRRARAALRVRPDADDARGRAARRHHGRPATSRSSR